MELGRIDDVICEIMYQDGPDKHIDGHEVITEFIEAILAGNGEVWAAEYAAKKGSTRFLDA